MPKPCDKLPSLVYWMKAQFGVEMNDSAMNGARTLDGRGISGTYGLPTVKRQRQDLVGGTIDCFPTTDGLGFPRLSGAEVDP
jgi:hypothetical protein